LFSLLEVYLSKEARYSYQEELKKMFLKPDAT
jgi:hypothetical protein